MDKQIGFYFKSVKLYAKHICSFSLINFVLLKEKRYFIAQKNEL